VNLESRKLPHKSMLGVKFKKLSSLKRFGGIVMVTTKKKIQGKIINRDMVSMFVGYLQNHPEYCYRLFDFKTRKVMTSGDLILLDKDDDSWV
jgi:hypothetical protein